MFEPLIWIGLVTLPSYEHYWSSSKVFPTNFGAVMSRNHFEILMQMLYFLDNCYADTINRLYKLGFVMDDIIVNSNYSMQPQEDLCISLLFS